MKVYCVGGKDFASFDEASEWASANGYWRINEIDVVDGRRYFVVEHTLRIAL